MRFLSASAFMMSLVLMAAPAVAQSSHSTIKYRSSQSLEGVVTQGVEAEYFDGNLYSDADGNFGLKVFGCQFDSANIDTNIASTTPEEYSDEWFAATVKLDTEARVERGESVESYLFLLTNPRFYSFSEHPPEYFECSGDKVNLLIVVPYPERFAAAYGIVVLQFDRASILTGDASNYFNVMFLMNDMNDEELAAYERNVSTLGEIGLAILKAILASR